MDITRAILDGIAMAAIFNGQVAALYWLTQDFSSIPIQREYKILLQKRWQKRKKNKFNTYDYNFRNRIYIWSDLSFIYGNKRT